MICEIIYLKQGLCDHLISCQSFEVCRSFQDVDKDGSGGKEHFFTVIKYKISILYDNISQKKTHLSKVNLGNERTPT